MSDWSPRLAVVIVNWNAGDRLDACLASLIEARDAHSHRMTIVVVDNGSTDDSMATARRHAEAVLFDPQGDNLGFARACNRGVAVAAAAGPPADLLLFLNPDTRVFADTFATLFAQPELRDPRYGVFGVRMEGPGGPAVSTSNFPTALSLWIKALGLSRALGRFDWAQHHRLGRDHAASGDVDQVMGAFLLIRPDLFRRLGGFDERFFVYFEDVDLCLRAARAGFRTRFIAASEIFHEGGGATGAVKGERLYLSLSSRLRYFDKHGSRAARASVAALTWVVEPLIRLVVAGLRGRGQAVRDVLHAWRALLSRGVK